MFLRHIYARHLRPEAACRYQVDGQWHSCTRLPTTSTLTREQPEPGGGGFERADKVIKEGGVWKDVKTAVGSSYVVGKGWIGEINKLKHTHNHTTTQTHMCTLFLSSALYTPPHPSSTTQMITTSSIATHPAHSTQQHGSPFISDADTACRLHPNKCIPHTNNSCACCTLGMALLCWLTFRVAYTLTWPHSALGLIYSVCCSADSLLLFLGTTNTHTRANTTPSFL